MVDVFQKCITANDYKQGSCVVNVQIGATGIPANNVLNPVHNNIDQIPAQTGLLDTRFDDTTYYTT